MQAHLHSCEVDFNSSDVYSRGQNRICSADIITYYGVHSFIYQHTLSNFNICTSKRCASKGTLDVRHRITIWSRLKSLCCEWNVEQFIFLGFLVTAVKSHGNKKKKKSQPQCLQCRSIHALLKLLLTHCVITAFSCFSKGASNDGGLCVRWICSVTLLVMLMFITSLM